MQRKTLGDQNTRDRALRLSPTVSGLAAATLLDPDASSHRSDQGRYATDVCPGALFQAWVLLAHEPTRDGGEGQKRERTEWAQRTSWMAWKRRGGKRKQEKKKGVGEFTCHFLQTSSAGRDILRHISVRNQFGQKEMLQVQTYLQLTPTDLGDEQEVLTLILRNKRLREATHKPRLCAAKKPDKSTSFQSGTATQKSTHDLHTTTRFHSEEQHTIKMMRREKKGANYSRAAGWPETNLIIIIVKKAQRKPAASPLPPQSNREAFSLRNDLESDKSNRFTVTAWKGPARTL